jgi:hypothetical protein
MREGENMDIDYKARIEKAMEKADQDMKFYMKEAKREKCPFEMERFAGYAALYQREYYSLRLLLADKFMGI